VGAGLIGLKCAEGISKKAKITCIDLAPKVLSSILDDEAAALVKAHLEENGMTFRLGTQVTEFKKNEALLSNGETVEFDVAVLAVGVRPNVGLIKDIGGAVGRGVTVNAKCETSLPDIYAAGDCTESPDASTGDVKIMALLPNAYMQGETAGLNMSGGDDSFDDAIPLNAIGFFGLHIATAGSYAGDVYFEGEGKNYKKLYYSDDKLNGMILIGAIEKAGVYTSLIREKTPLSSIDFELICKKPGLMAFSRKVRSEKLGGIL
jgi:NAD(P)H-nitrite reductase large subunit